MYIICLCTVYVYAAYTYYYYYYIYLYAYKLAFRGDRVRSLLECVINGKLKAIKNRCA